MSEKNTRVELVNDQFINFLDEAGAWPPASMEQLEEFADKLVNLVNRKTSYAGSPQKYSEALRTYDHLLLTSDDLSPVEKAKLYRSVDPWTFLPSDNLEEPLKEKALELRERALEAAGIVRAREVTSYNFILAKAYNAVFGLGDIESEDGEAVAHIFVDTANSKDRAAGIVLKTLIDIDMRQVLKNNKMRLSATLDKFDELVHWAIGNLYLAGNRYITLTRIAKECNMSSNSGNLRKILASLTKMMGTIVSIDNSEEAERYTGYSLFNVKYRNLIYAKTDVEATINGRFTKTAIFIMDLPVLFQYAIERGEFTPLTKKDLRTGLKTNNNTLAIQRYVTDRVSRCKTEKLSILLPTLYENTGQETKLQKQRCREYAMKTLEALKASEKIEGYTKEKDRFVVFFDSKNPRQKTKKNVKKRKA